VPRSPLRVSQVSTGIGVPLANVARNLGIRAPLTPSHIVKYYVVVHIVTRKHLQKAMRQYPDTANEIKAWVVIVKGARWHNFPELRSAFKQADNVEGYVIFNIRQNRYRLVTIIHYSRTTNQKRIQGHVYIPSFLTHKEYDNPANWDRKFGTR
jgi:mRNA interferase HigB